MILESFINTSVSPAGTRAVVVKELEFSSPETVLATASCGAAKIRSELAMAC